MEKREYQAENPVTGETRSHETKTAAKVDQAFQDVKQHIPGTQEHAATTPGTTMSGQGMTGMGTTTTAPMMSEHEKTTTTTTHSAGTTPTMTGGATHTGGQHTVVNPATGEVHEHGTRAGAAVHQAYENVKEALPGTKEHRATHPERQL